MKTKICYIILIVIILSVVYACKRTLLSETDVSEFKTKQAKEWYYSIFKKSPQWTLAKSTTGTKLPDWNKFIEYKIGNIQIVEYPLLQEKKVRRFTDNSMTTEERNKLFNATLDKVLFIKMKNGNIIVRTVQITPNLDYLRSKNYDISNNSFTCLDKNFSGTLKLFKWDGNFVKGYTYNNGKSINAIKKISRIKPTLKNENLRTTDENSTVCDYHVDYYYQQTCNVSIYGDGLVTEDCGEPVLDHIEYYEYNCREDPCTGENFTEDCFCENYGFCDEDEIDHLNNYPAALDIINNLTNSCWKALFNTIKSNGLTNDISTLLKNTFGSSTKYNVIISEEANLTNSQGVYVEGNTSVSYDLNGNLVLNIKLNSTALADATKEYISATIYHEIVHAYLRATGMMSRLQQEDAIAYDYVTCLIAALQETFPSMSLDSATALSWGGLEGTPTYNNTLTDTQKTNYLLENNYQHAGQNGTTCN